MVTHITTLSWSYPVPTKCNTPERVDRALRGVVCGVPGAHALASTFTAALGPCIPITSSLLPTPSH